MSKATIIFQDKAAGGLHLDLLLEPPAEGALTPAQVTAHRVVQNLTAQPAPQPIEEPGSAEPEPE